VLSRREFAQLIGGAGAAAVLARSTTAFAQSTDLGDGHVIRPRADWAGSLAPTGPLVAEDEVMFLLVHHTVNANTYGPDEVTGLLRGVYALHTGPEKGWADVAYNYFVDRFGGVWEGRAGSLAGAVQPDATGGSQGFAQLCCFIGDHSVEPPTPEAKEAMVYLLAFLGERYGIDTSPGVTVQFVSRGSNRWPAGASVEATTIAGHRDMSQTACPGDAAYPLVQGEFPQAVTALRVRRAAEAAPPTTVPAPPSTAEPPTSAPSRGHAASPAASVPPGDGGGRGSPLGEPAVIGGVLGIAALLGGAVAVRRRRSAP
jgi:hypothetical protein